MPNNVNIGKRRILIDEDGDAVKVSATGRLLVDADLSVQDVQIGAVEIKNATDDQRATVNTAGELLVTAPPATFDTVATSQITAADSTAWVTFPSVAAQEIMISTPSSNVDTFEISSDSTEMAGVELKPTDALSLPLTNLNKLEYRKPTSTNGTDKLLIIALSNA